MPAPITHIVLSEKVFKKHFDQKKRSDFIIGTSLPDIRHFDNIDRSQTHFSGLALADIKKEEAFDSGFKFHSLVDELHDKFFSLRENPFFLEPIRITATSLKFFEDELFYSRLSDWSKIANFFDRVLEAELKFDDRPDVVVWHREIKKYFSQSPNRNSRREFLRATEFSDDLDNQVESFIEKMKQFPQIEEAIEEFYEKFEELLI